MISIILLRINTSVKDFKRYFIAKVAYSIAKSCNCLTISTGASQVISGSTQGLGEKVELCLVVRFV